MYFSHLMLCDRREGLSSQARYEQLFEEVRLMEALGYWCCWFAEHHFAGYALMPDCLLMAAAAARETSRIRLGAGVVVLPFQHHPIRVVEQAAMMDCLSKGRLELGFGRGYQPHEFTGFGISLEEGYERFDQALHGSSRPSTNLMTSPMTPRSSRASTSPSGPGRCSAPSPAGVRRSAMPRFSAMDSSAGRSSPSPPTSLPSSSKRRSIPTAGSTVNMVTIPVGCGLG